MGYHGALLNRLLGEKRIGVSAYRRVGDRFPIVLVFVVVLVLDL